MEFLDGAAPGAVEVPPDGGDGMAVADVLPPVTVEGVTLDMVYDIISEILGVLNDDGADVVPVELAGQTRETLDAAMVVVHQLNACVLFISMCLLYRMVKNSVGRIFNND